MVMAHVDKEKIVFCRAANDTMHSLYSSVLLGRLNHASLQRRECCFLLKTCSEIHGKVIVNHIHVLFSYNTLIASLLEMQTYTIYNML